MRNIKRHIMHSFFISMLNQILSPNLRHQRLMIILKKRLINKQKKTERANGAENFPDNKLFVRDVKIAPTKTNTRRWKWSQSNHACSLLFLLNHYFIISCIHYSCFRQSLFSLITIRAAIMFPFLQLGSGLIPKKKTKKAAPGSFIIICTSKLR